MKAEELHYPCLCVHRKLTFTVENALDLIGATADGHRTGVLQDLKIIDSRGREFSVEPPKPRNRIVVFWEKLTRKRPPRIPLDLTLSAKTWTVHQIRQLLLIDSQRAGPVSRIRSKELKASIDAARTPAEILKLISRQSSNTSMA